MHYPIPAHRMRSVTWTEVKKLTRYNRFTKQKIEISFENNRRRSQHPHRPAYRTLGRIIAIMVYATADGTSRQRLRVGMVGGGR
ncbi:hypothetical protein, partial [Mesorhizobium sp. M2A.F.Ca.ET.067.02.1.1]|uniref:hypothetical protein n=1 Tax=Mesorhizobium sp. M2A.F.Ca.ET.067.02.1.1 TaxID=2496749 RepID=UPI000FD2158B